ncbi:DUF5668 domain-containing protein [Radiobacillus kanasensis]|uniref:LiaI-LiaF-like domain-containing protein n=1 Tax=Radiobacillus kanasensis TaxID=2844358 RepID=UPI001E5827C8|nr:DUF5668 domain-containing protein [Radiobacillus kanasensis]UFT97954.1 DUF5668 domain-containing protein [Radiobacillus kanasensis]
MKKQHLFTAYILIGIGVYFLLRQLRLPILTDFYSWPTLLMILGIAFLIHSYTAKDYSNILPGVILLGIGIHSFAITHYPFWIDHWGMYPMIIAIAFLLRYSKTKSGLLPGFLLLAIGLFAIFSRNKPAWFSWINQIFEIIETFWPVTLIAIGLYIVFRKK